MAANLKGFGDIYQGLDAGDRQLLVGLMVKRIRIAPTRIELELYDHPTLIEDWSKGDGDGWFRTRLSWLPTTRSYRTAILASVNMGAWGFEEAYREFWKEMGRRAIVGMMGAMVIVRLSRRNLTYQAPGLAPTPAGSRSKHIASY